jgi:hypothetical protein
MNMRKAFEGALLPVMGAALLLLVAGGCDGPSGPSDNVPPNVQLALNEPMENDTLFALVDLHWDGGDPDGFVEAYEYRYRYTYCRGGDCDDGDTTSAVTDWTRTTSTSDTIAFNSKAELNRQVFEVRAIDNSGALSRPVARSFYTLPTSPPVTEIARPNDGAQSFALRNTTDWWQGLALTYTGSDEDGEIVEFGWSVDGGSWHWTEDTTVVVPPEVFTRGGRSLTGEHTIQTTARDNTNLVSHEGNGAGMRTDTVSVELIQPAFENDLLIIDETNEAAQGPPAASDAEVDSLYQAIFEPDRMWDYQEQGGLPSKRVMGRYDMILWHADNNFASSADAHELPQHSDVLAEYMSVGGDFIMSGWRMLKTFVPNQSFPYTFEDTSFVNEYLHIVKADESSGVPGNFVGAYGTNSAAFSDVSVDSDKVPSGFPYGGKMSDINVIVDEKSFTSKIYFFNAHLKQGEEVSEFRRSPVGLRYRGTVFDAVVLGFPIYFLEDEDAAMLADEVLRSMGYR